MPDAQLNGVAHKAHVKSPNLGNFNANELKDKGVSVRLRVSGRRGSRHYSKQRNGYPQVWVTVLEQLRAE